MCNFKSFIVLKNRVYVPDGDSHSDMLRDLGIADDYLNATKTFVRGELLPPHGDMTKPVAEWSLKVDQDITPDWWCTDVDGARARDAVDEWVREHVFTSGEHTVKDGLFYAYNSSTVKAYDNSTINAYDISTINAYNNSTVKAYNNSTIKAYDNSTITACDSSVVIRPADEKVYIADGWTAVSRKEGESCQ